MTNNNTDRKRVNGSIVAACTEVADLRLEVKKLQKENNNQLELENETSDTLLYFQDQIKALQKAFSLLTDVTVEEIESMKKQSVNRENKMEEKINNVTDEIIILKKDINEMKNTLHEMKVSKENIDLQNRIINLENEQSILSKTMKDNKISNYDALEYIVKDILNLKKTCDKNKLKEKNNVEELKLKLNQILVHYKEKMEEEIYNLNNKIENVQKKDGSGKKETLISIATDIKNIKKKLKCIDETRAKDLKGIQKLIRNENENFSIYMEQYQDSAIFLKNEINSVNFKIKVFEESISNLKLDIIDGRSFRLSQEKSCYERFHSLKNLFNNNENDNENINVSDNDNDNDNDNENMNVSDNDNDNGNDNDNDNDHQNDNDNHDDNDHQNNNNDDKKRTSGENNLIL